MSEVVTVSQPKKRGLRQRVAEAIWRAPRVREAFDRLKQDAGFIPIFNVDDVEIRRQQIKQILDKVKTNIFDPEKGDKAKIEVIQDTFGLFFCEGDPWYRGLDDRELAEKVPDFLANCMDAGYMIEFWPDLFEESLQLLHLSWKALDVTNTPPFIIESRPIVGTGSGRQTVEGEIDMAGVMALRQDLEEQAQEMERLRAQVDKYKK
jgi:hypothetical protein